jgi:hypothetical protein
MSTYLVLVVLISLLLLSACRLSNTSSLPLVTSPTVAAPTDAPVTSTNVPATSTNVPATSTNAPATSTNAPATPTNVPVTSTDVPATPSDAPATSANVPATPVVLTVVPSLTPAESVANADVEYVRAVQASDGSWMFHVTVRHADTGWEDYADGWDVLTPEGTVLKPDPSSPYTRLLLHPHETEQPFTRSQSGILIPSDVTQVRVRAHDLVDGFGGREVIVDLTMSSGPDFEVVGTP